MDKELERTTKYQELDQASQDLYGSPQSGMRLAEIYKRFSLPEELYKQYAESVGDVILGFNKISDLPRILQQKLNTSADESQRITSSLIELLAPIVKREEAETKAKQDSLKNLAQNFAKPAQASSEAPQAPAPEIQADAVEPIRTMEGDINRIHSYGAYQNQQREDTPQAEQ